ISTLLRLISENCDTVLANTDDYNVQKLQNNKWLITISNQPPVTTICPKSNPETQVYASIEYNETIASHLYIPSIECNCCKDLPKPEELPKLKSIKINHLNLDELKITDSKLREYDKTLNKYINEPFATRQWTTLTYIIISAVTLTIIWLIIKGCIKRKYIGYFKGLPSSDDGHHPELTMLSSNFQ
ncbi:hypothetical protein BDFB_012911, partial [Asbolus verrucosus]